MKEKICLIHQSSGLGDILFSQKISRTYLNMGFRVINPVIPSYHWIGDYILDMEFPLETDDFPFKDVYTSKRDLIQEEDFVYIPLFNSQNLIHPPVGYIMDQKYRMMNMEWNDWANYLQYTRNVDKENSLFYDVLGLKDDELFNFVSLLYQPPHMVLKFQDVAPANGLKNVYLEFIQGYSMFDWIKVVENASNIYMVDSSMCYLVETLKLKAKETILYPRNPRTKFIELKPVFNFNWTYIE